jgi:hypothetical protein
VNDVIPVVAFVAFLFVLVPGFLVGVRLAEWLAAERCPVCRGKWRSELVGEVDGVEDWTCARCGFWWQVERVHHEAD